MAALLIRSFKKMLAISGGALVAIDEDDGGGSPVDPPTNTVAPSISGTPTSGQTLTGSDGTWTGSPTFTRQWMADGVAISGETNSTLLLTDALVGKTITFALTGSNEGGSATATSSGVGPVAANIPFSFDSNTYFWDFAASDKTLDTNGTTTVTKVLERTGNKVALRQQNKSLQPLSVTNGVGFSSLTNRSLTFDTPPAITNGKNGWYFAATLTCTTANSYIMEISRAGTSGTIASRGQVYVSGSRNIVLKCAASDGGTLTAVFTGPQLTLGVTYAIEILWDFDADTCTLWINGVQQTLTVTGAPWSNFPASNPFAVTIGNSFPGALSFDGVLNNIVFQDGVPSSGIRTSVSAFQQTRQQAA